MSTIAISLEDKLNDIEGRLRSVEQTLQLVPIVQDHETRIRKLEIGTAKHMGLVAGAAAGASGLAQLLIHSFGG